MAEYSIFQSCPYCKEGVVTSSGSTDGVPFSNPRPCVSCGGTGLISAGKIVMDPGVEDVLDKVNDVLDKCNDILEKLDE